MTSGEPRPSRLVAVALVGLLLAAGAVPSSAGSGTGAPAAQNPAALDGDAERGAALFTDYTCYGCHGYTGETGRGPRLNPPRLRQDRFIAYLRNPPNPRRMPPYRQAEVSDRKLADIYAYIESLPSASPAAEDIPVLQEILRETRP
jgi:mono/diheme cytochrome c family protein